MRRNEDEVTSDATQTKILILQRGWVVVGQHTISGDEHVLTDASVIRRWGTTKGIGEIALDGPTSSTILDPCGTVRVHKLAVVMSLDCVEEKWAGQ